MDQTLALTLKRMDSYHKEFKLLYYGLCSARIFFRPTEENSDMEENVHDNINEINDDVHLVMDREEDYINLIEESDE